MRAVERYRSTLRETADWIPLLLERSGLPGPRANLELVHAVALEGDAALFDALLEWTPERAPTGSREEYLAVCGAVGLGHVLVAHSPDAERARRLWARLRELANDPRWRVREGVAMALQWIGSHQFDRMIRGIDPWVVGSLLERRAVVAGLCEPALLRTAEAVAATLDRLDTITASLGAELDRGGDPFRVLRQALGYGWSVVVAADPAQGRPRFERWARSGDPDVRRVVRENLGKARLRRVDPAWCEALLAAG